VSHLAYYHRDEDAEDAQWRWDEREIDGGFSGNEYPRLWPPRRHPEAPGGEM
jgi:hypothetical protein